MIISGCKPKDLKVNILASVPNENCIQYCIFIKLKQEKFHNQFHFNQVTLKQDKRNGKSI